jgi:hypothetical protein
MEPVRGKGARVGDAAGAFLYAERERVGGDGHRVSLCLTDFFV